MKRRNGLIAAFMALMVVFAMMPALGYVYADTDDYVLYANAVSDKGTVYRDGDTVEIPQGEKAFLEFVTDFERNGEHGASTVIGLSDGRDGGNLSEAGFGVKTGTGTDLGYERTGYGIEIDTAGLEAGRQGMLKYWVYEDAAEIDSAKTPHMGDWSLTVKVTENEAKLANTLNIWGRTVTVRSGKLRRRDQQLAASKVMNLNDMGQGEISYTLKSASKDGQSFVKFFAVNSVSGKVTVKKGLKTGTYTVKVNVKAGGDDTYEASAEKPVVFKLTVK